MKTKVQSIYYQSKSNGLGITHATSHKRITINEAEEILTDQSIEYEEILKVKYEDITLEMPLDEFRKYMV